MMRKISFKKIFLLASIFGFVWFIAPNQTDASEIRLDTTKAEVWVDEEFTVDVVFHADEEINAIEGALSFNPDMIEVVDIRDGDSMISFWLEHPHVDEENFDRVLFSGITPGGFSGPKNQIFSVVFRAVQGGQVSSFAEIRLENIKTLLNDGEGTQSDFSIRNTSVEIKPGDGRSRKEILNDTEPPEAFTPVISKDSSVFGEKWFIVFTTQDKLSGIDRYEIKEGKWSWFKKAESPYLIKNQDLDSDIFIKAIDKSGNERLSIIAVEGGKSQGNNTPLIILAIIFVLVLIFILRKTLKKKWRRSE